MGKPIHAVVAALNADGSLSDKTVGRLIHVADPEGIFEETCRVALMIHPDFELPRFLGLWTDILDLFAGRYPGYQACNTRYHDLSHTLETLLAMVRLCHGAHLAGDRFSPADLHLGLAAALLHDSGYIQKEGDNDGTGAKYSLDHVALSADFADGYLESRGFGPLDRERCRAMIMATDLAFALEEVAFPDETSRRLGKILATVDLLGQMASRIYLEKLLFLYRELVEGGVEQFEDELDLLVKTRPFYRFIEDRLAGPLEGLDRLMRLHFAQAFGVEADPYRQYARKNMIYLCSLLECREDYRAELKRDGVVSSILHEDKG
ncbi:MAG: hypothetical protein KKA60_01325 [Proteobacteria bacterium]|nr:hypothetical protein [Pseudomonadota bacterium]